MGKDLLSRLKLGPVLCDGAMGTLLYANGVFINNVMTSSSHAAGPDPQHPSGLPECRRGVIETNTFGGNSVRLGRYGLADQVRDVNFKGAKAGPRSRRCFHLKKGAGRPGAGSVGPLGVELSLWERPRARKPALPSVNRSWPDGSGVDLLMLETFGYLEELHQAILAARDVAPGTQLVARSLSTKTAIALTEPVQKRLPPS